MSSRPRADLASTKENSPTWARLKAASRAVRMEYRSTRTAGTTMRIFARMMAAAHREMTGRCVRKNLTSSSMPTEMKKMLENTSLKGMMLSSVLRLYSDSAIMRPARNAPRASERPSHEVMSATARHRPRVVMSMSSRLRVLTTLNMSRWSRYLPKRRMPPMTSTPLPTAKIMELVSSSRPPASSGKMSTMGTMARS